MMGGALSKFSRINLICSFPGKVFSDNQDEEEIEDFSEENDTWYSDYYQYDSILTIEDDSQ